MDDREAVAWAYNTVRRAGGLGYLAFQAAVAAYRRRHPDISERAVELTVSRLISDAATYIPEIIWDSVGSGPVKRYRPGAMMWE